MTKYQEPTPRHLEDVMKMRCPKQGEVDSLYVARDAFIERLRANGLITLQDIHDLDRLGRAKVASDHWAICSQEARKALLSDAHHQVRSCASVIERCLSPI